MSFVFLLPPFPITIVSDEKIPLEYNPVDRLHIRHQLLLSARNTFGPVPSGREHPNIHEQRRCFVLARPDPAILVAGNDG